MTWTTVLAIASAIVLLANATKVLVGAWKAAKAPGAQLQQRIESLETWQEKVNKRLGVGDQHFDAIDASNRVTQLALLALLDHGIDGNNIDQMQHAKEELQAHLINR